jgi:ADP-heptose:LPS heptosyltransferase
LPESEPAEAGVDRPVSALKPKLLVVELWGLGDLIIGTPFLQAAGQRYEVTLVAKPYAIDLQPRFWPGVKVVPFVAPWTAFKRKYRLYAWPWWCMLRLLSGLAKQRFDYGLSARRGADGSGDPRDHLLLLLARAKTRLGFPWLGSGLILAQPLARPEPQAHRYENWRVMARALGLETPLRESLVLSHSHPDGEILVHTGAGQPVRVWPLPRYRGLVARLRGKGNRVQVACDPDQREWWLAAGEMGVATPRSVSELLLLTDRAGAFIGNDSGPGHLAAFCGVPTFTLFGPQVPEWFAPLHPASEWVEGKACPYKPCSDYCRFSVPCCMENSSEDEVGALAESFVTRNLPRT